MLPTQSPEQAVAEMRRVRALPGIAGMLLPVTPDVSDWIDPLWEPVWACAQELALVLSVHAGKPRWMPRRDALDGRGQMMLYMHLGFASVVEALAQILWSGALDRHPGLRVVTVEGDLGWLPHFKRRAAKMFQRHGAWAGAGRDPGELFGRNLFATFESDPIGIALRHEIGVDAMLWASDYPHSASSFPGSMKQIAEDLGALPEDERRRITWDNARKLYDIQAPA